MTQFIALLISLAIEVPIILLLTHLTKRFTSFVQFIAMLALACGATLLTHPMAWMSNKLVISYLFFPARVIFIETVVIFIEGFLYSQVLDLGWRKGFSFALIANLASFLGGLIIFQFLQF